MGLSGRSRMHEPPLSQMHRCMASGAQLPAARLFSALALIARKDVRGDTFRSPLAKRPAGRPRARNITGEPPRSNYAWIVMLMALAVPAAAETAIPDLRGTWTGESDSIVLGGTPHHPKQQAGQPRLTSRRLHTGHRQAGWPPLLRYILLGAPQRDGHRRLFALRYDLYGRRRRL